MREQRTRSVRAADKPTKSVRKPTLSDVAKAAGVSLMTVSNVVNRRTDLLKPDTYARVREVIRKVGYRPQIQARGLRLSRFWVIGMIVAMHKKDFLTSPWMGQMISGLSNHLSAHGYGLLIDSPRPKALDESVIVKSANTDGIIAILSGSDSERRTMWQELSALSQPIIALQETIVSGRARDMAILRQDDFGGARELAAHVLTSGARRLRFLEPDFSWPNMAERIRGVSLEVARTKSSSLEVIKCKDDNHASVEATVLKDLRDNGLPDAYLAANEAIGLAALNTLEKAGHRVPGDVLLTGFNAFDLWFFAQRKITTIDYPAYALGEKAAEMMLGRLQDGRFLSKANVLPGRFIQGDTTGMAVPEGATVAMPNRAKSC